MKTNSKFTLPIVALCAFVALGSGIVYLSSGLDPRSLKSDSSDANGGFGNLDTSGLNAYLNSVGAPSDTNPTGGATSATSTAAPAAVPSATLSYNGQTVDVYNGTFTFNNQQGTVDSAGNVMLGGTTVGHLGSDIVYAPAGGATNVTTTATTTSTATVTSAGGATNTAVNGTVKFNNQDIVVTNGNFCVTIGGTSMCGTIDDKGNYNIPNGPSGNINTTNGVTGYQAAGGAFVSINNGKVIVTFTGSNGMVSNVDVVSLVAGIKAFPDWSRVEVLSGLLQGNGWNRDDINAFIAQTNSLSNVQIAELLAQKLTPANITALDNVMHLPVPGAVILDNLYFPRYVYSNAEFWQNALNHIGVTCDSACVEKYYNVTPDQLNSVLQSFTTQQRLMLQGYVYDATNPTTGQKYYQNGVDDTPSYSPALNRILSPAEMDALIRCRGYVTANTFIDRTQPGSVLTDVGKRWSIGNGNYAREAFDGYCGEDTIKSYVGNTGKGVLVKSSNGCTLWGDGTRTDATGNLSTTCKLTSELPNTGAGGAGGAGGSSTSTTTTSATTGGSSTSTTTTSPVALALPSTQTAGPTISDYGPDATDGSVPSQTTASLASNGNEQNIKRELSEFTCHASNPTVLGWYLKYLGRCADKLGMTFWEGELGSYPTPDKTNQTYLAFKAAAYQSFSGEAGATLSEKRQNGNNKALCPSGFSYVANTLYCKKSTGSPAAAASNDGFESDAALTVNSSASTSSSITIAPSAVTATTAQRVTNITDGIKAKGNGLNTNQKKILFLENVIKGLKELAAKPKYLSNPDVQAIVTNICAKLEQEITTLR